MFNYKKLLASKTSEQPKQSPPARQRALPSAIILPLFLSAIVMLVVITVSGCLQPPSGGGKQDIKDGVLTAKGITIDLGDNASGSETQTTLSIIKPEEAETPDGLASELYELKTETVYEAPVTVTLKFDEECPVDDDEAQPMLGLGSTFEMEDGSVETLYRYIPVQEKDGQVTVSFIPSDYAQLFVHGNSNTGSSAPNKERTRFGLFWVSTTYIDGGHFIVYMPLKARTLFLDYNERRVLLDDLEKVYNDYLNKGYAYSKRGEWPMEVNVSNIDNLGEYSYSWNGAEGHINLRRSLFEKGYQAGTLDSLLAHEFFHFVQLNYVNVGDDLLWFDEATATYYEWTKLKNIPNIVTQYSELMFTGAYPQQNTSANGYARMPLIKYLAKTLGEEFILNAYFNASQGADWDSALLAAAGDPADWVGDYYEALISDDFLPLALHRDLVQGISTVQGIGTSLELVLPEKDEMAELISEGEPVTLGQTTIHVGACGAQLIALHMHEYDVKHFPDGSDPIVTFSAGDLRVLKVFSREIEVLKDSGGGVTLDDYKKASGSKYLYLAIVTNPSDNAQDIKLSVEIEVYPTLDELVGSYDDGMATYTEVFISDSLRAQLANPGAAQENLAVEDELGCDINLNVIGSLERMVGQSAPVTIIIEKSGENTGTLRFVSENDTSGMTESPIPYTYEKGSLILNFSQSYSIQGSIAASYGKDKNVIIDGALVLTLVPEQLWMKIQITGTKPLSTP